MGDVQLFRRLAADVSLGAELRRRARYRQSLAYYKLAIEELRVCRPAGARRHLAGAWLFPERVVPVAMLWLSTFMPPGLLRRLADHRFATRGVLAPMARNRRVVLSSATDHAPDGAEKLETETRIETAEGRRP
jgi:hypothetical protein